MHELEKAIEEIAARTNEICPPVTEWNKSAWTQGELKEKYDVEILRRPENEALVFQVISFCGEKRVRYNHYPGNYEALHWIVWLHTRLNSRLDSPIRGLLEITSSSWSKLRKKLGEDQNPFFNLTDGEIYTVVADEDLRVISLEQGDKLDEYLNSD